MKYISTRGNGSASPAQAVLQGIAPDGGLYVPESFPKFDWKACLHESPLGVSARILQAFFPFCADMDKLVKKAYFGKFSTPLLCPLSKVGDMWVLELFHGPTSAFKDVALSVLPRLLSQAREGSGIDTIHILTATSGDTGKAALEGFHDVPGTEITVFFPQEGVSAVQRAQMTTQEGDNVHVIAVEGNFDDCQRGVKEAFASLSGAMPEGMALSSANSINIGRLIPQIAYYFMAYDALLHRGVITVGDKVNFSVPTGNFGDILAGYYAKKLGLPVGKLLCASNDNNVLTDFLATGIYDTRRPFQCTTSPSMDILVSSNLERLLFDVMDGDASKLSQCMNQLNQQGHYFVDDSVLAQVQESFAGYCCTQKEGAETIKKLWERYHYLCDPHTAVGVAAAEKYAERGDNTPMVVLATASPFKFPEAVLFALGRTTRGDGFKQMRRLGEYSRQLIPTRLTALEKKKPLHRQVIKADAVAECVGRIVRGEE